MPKRVNVRCDETGVIFDVNTKRIFVDDITKLTNAQISVLECGDFVVKQTGNQKHTYKVTYKEEEQGLCLTYDDASCIETVSYDYVEGNWVYNSTDISSIESGGGTTVVANPTLDGTEADLTGLQVGNTKYKTKKYYHHYLELTFVGHNDCVVNIKVNTPNPNHYTVSNLKQLFDDAFLYNARMTIFEESTSNRYVNIFDEFYSGTNTVILNITGIGFDDDNLFVKGNVMIDLDEVDEIEYLAEVEEV